MTVIQRATLSIVHIYAKAYGWSKNEILDSVYLDEHFLMQDIIKDDIRQDTILKFNLLMMPHAEQDVRDKFIDSIANQKDTLDVQENQKTDFEAIKKAKEKLNKINDKK